VQGKSRRAVQQLIDDALSLQDAGVFAILLEALPAEAAACVRERLEVIVYGIGAGPHVDGQLVISHDILGSFVGDIAPRFVKPYAHVGQEVQRVFTQYATDVRAGAFPSPELWYPVNPDVEQELRALRGASEAAVA
jgi:3-methyl-2-oxobutanoate hydroxymethyltransferase